MNSNIFVFKKILNNLDKDIYIKGTSFGLKRLLFYFLCLIVLLLISYFIDILVSIFIAIVIIVSTIFFYYLAYKNGILITLHVFTLDDKINFLVDSLRLDKISESARVIFFKNSKGLYYTNSKLSLLEDRESYISDFEIIMSKCKKNANILILGGGGESLSCVAAAQENVKLVDTVDISKEILDAGKMFFIPLLKIKHQKKIRQFVDDAKLYIKKTNKKYDAIVVDLFFDNNIADFVFKKEFLQDLINSFSRSGLLLVHFSNNKNNALKFKKVVSKWYDSFNVYYFDSYYVKYYIGSNKELSLGSYYKKIA